jgi:short-subunit dehydrogenase
MPLSFLWLFHDWVMLQLCTKGIKITVVCPGPIETPQSSGAASSVQSHPSEVISGFTYLILQIQKG